VGKEARVHGGRESEREREIDSDRDSDRDRDDRDPCICDSLMCDMTHAYVA